MIRLAPRNGMSVIDPATRRPMPVDGIERTELDSYWRRRLNDGDVVQVEAVAAPAQEVTPAATTMAAPRTNRKKNGRGQVNDNLV